MAIPMFGSVGALFNRLGKLGNVIKQLRSYQATQLTAMTDTTNGVVAQYNSESDIQAQMGSNYIGLLNGSGGLIGSTMRQMAADTVNRMVFRDNPLLNLTLQQTNTPNSIAEIIRQMKQQGATVLAMTITATPSVFTGVGNGVIVASTKRPSDGLVLENSFAETVLLTVTSDSYSGSATAGNESLQVNGVGNNSDPFSFNWPLGSNALTTVNAIDGNSDASNGNELTNSGYENWTNNSPDNNTLVVGTGGVNVFRESSIVYDGDFSLNVTGDAGGTLVEWTQQFDNVDGTIATLSPQTQYAYNVFLRRGGSAITGTFEVSLIDSNGDIVEDENGVQNVLTINLANLTTSFAAFNTAFRTPSIMPDPIFIRRRFTVAMAAGGLFYMDKEALGLMTQLYTSGPFFAAFSGSVPFLIGDHGTCIITNSRGAGGTLSTFQTLADVLLGMRELDLLLPSSPSPSVSDSLIS